MHTHKVAADTCWLSCMLHFWCICTTHQVVVFILGRAAMNYYFLLFSSSFFQFLFLFMAWWWCSYAGTTLYNNLLQRDGEKSTNWASPMKQFLCPTETHPYFYTYDNSWYSWSWRTDRVESGDFFLRYFAFLCNQHKLRLFTKLSNMSFKLLIFFFNLGLGIGISDNY